MTPETLTFGSLFAGIGGFDLGLERAGMVCKWQVEIDPFCLGVLKKHWPEVERRKDVRDVGKHNLEAVDLVCGGFPCQDVSMAGKRAGLAGERTGLWFEFHRIVEELHPGWVVAENVPGLLSSNGWRDMGTVLGSLAELGYGYAWRVLDAQYFGVAQRRRRVFVIASARPESAAKVLFDPDPQFLGQVRGGLVSPTLTASGQVNPSGGTWTGGIVVSTLKAGGMDTRSGVEYVASFGNPHPDAGGMREVAGVPGRVDGGLKDGVDQVGNHETGEIGGNGSGNRIEAGASGGGVAGLQEELEGGGGEAGRVLAGPQTGRVPGQLLLAPVPRARENPEGEPGTVAGEIGTHQGTGRGTDPRIGGGGLDGVEVLDARIDGGDGRTRPTSVDRKRFRALGNAVAVPVAEWIGKRIMKVAL